MLHYFVPTGQKIKQNNISFVPPDIQKYPVLIPDKINGHKKRPVNTDLLRAQNPMIVD